MKSKNRGRRKVLTIILVTLAVLGVQAPARAQEARRLTIEEAVQIGLQNSRSLVLAGQQGLEADAASTEARTARLPVINAQGSYIRLSDNIPDFAVNLPAMAPGASPTSITVAPAILNRYNLQLGVQQPLYTGGRIGGSIRAAEARQQAVRQDAVRVEADVTLQVQDAYWALYKARAYQNVIVKSLAQVESHLTDVRNLLAAGLATNSDVLATETRRSEILLRQVEADNASRLALLNLNYLLGLPLETQIDPVSTVEVAAVSGRIDTFVAQALETRSELATLHSQIEALDATVDIARAGRLPQVALVGNYRYARPNSYIFPPADEFRGTWDAGVSVTFDLWNWGKTKAQTDQARARAEQARTQLAQLEDAVQLDVNRRYLELRRAFEAVRVVEQSIQSAEESNRITRERFNQGLTLSSEVLDTEVALENALTRKAQVEAEYAVARAALQRALGQAGMP